MCPVLLHYVVLCSVDIPGSPVSKGKQRGIGLGREGRCEGGLGEVEGEEAAVEITV